MMNLKIPSVWLTEYRYSQAWSYVGINAGSLFPSHKIPPSSLNNRHLHKVLLVFKNRFSLNLSLWLIIIMFVIFSCLANNILCFATLWAILQHLLTTYYVLDFWRVCTQFCPYTHKHIWADILAVLRVCKWSPEWLTTILPWLPVFYPQKCWDLRSVFHSLTVVAFISIGSFALLICAGI